MHKLAFLLVIGTFFIVGYSAPTVREDNKKQLFVKIIEQEFKDELASIEREKLKQLVKAAFNATFNFSTPNNFSLFHLLKSFKKIPSFGDMMPRSPWLEEAEKEQDAKLAGSVLKLLSDYAQNSLSHKLNMQQSTNKGIRYLMNLLKLDDFTGSTQPTNKMADRMKFTGSAQPINRMADRMKFTGSAQPTNEMADRMKFTGSTQPNEMADRMKFTGSTQPNEMADRMKFIGSTQPTNKMADRMKFTGSTQPTNEMADRMKFTGSTQPNEMADRMKFTGSTQPTNRMADRMKFTGSAQPTNRMADRMKFTGSTQPTNEMADRMKFTGSTQPNEMADRMKFTGSTQPTNRMADRMKFTGSAQPTNRMADRMKFTGSTQPNEMADRMKFTGSAQPTNRMADRMKFTGSTQPNEMADRMKFTGSAQPTNKMADQMKRYMPVDDSTGSMQQSSADKMANQMKRYMQVDPLKLDESTGERVSQWLPSGYDIVKDQRDSNLAGTLLNLINGFSRLIPSPSKTDTDEDREGKEILQSIFKLFMKKFMRGFSPKAGIEGDNEFLRFLVGSESDAARDKETGETADSSVPLDTIYSKLLKFLLLD